MSDFPQIWNVGHTSDKEESVGWAVTSEVLKARLGPKRRFWAKKTDSENFRPKIAGTVESKLPLIVIVAP